MSLRAVHHSSFVNGAFIDGDVLATLSIERLAPPAAPTLAQPQARELRHQIKFGEPSVAYLNGIEPHLPIR